MVDGPTSGHYIADMKYGLIALLLLTGCHSKGEPKIRVGCYPTATWGTIFTDINDMGPHGYGRQPAEKCGIVYTTNAGHIDLTHVRSTADWTKYIAEKAYKHIQSEETYFSFKSNTESSRYHVYLSYPSEWSTLSHIEREERTWKVSVELGQYLIFSAATWHEILTWFGHRYLSPFPEFPSAFSWEDSFSNAMGVHLAGQVLRNGREDYDHRFTVLLRSELIRLGVQSKGVSKAMAESVKGTWYWGLIPGFVTVQRRNLDIGLDDGLVSPVLLPHSGGIPQTYPVPRLETLEAQGFSVRLEIEPREAMRHKILRIVYPDRHHRDNRIDVASHFPIIMKAIQEDAARRGMEYDATEAPVGQ